MGIWRGRGLRLSWVTPRARKVRARRLDRRGRAFREHTLMEDAGNEDASTLLPVCGRFPARNKSISSSKPVLFGNSGRLGAVTHSFAKDERVGTRLASISVFQLRGHVRRAL